MGSLGIGELAALGALTGAAAGGARGGGRGALIGAGIGGLSGGLGGYLGAPAAVPGAAGFPAATSTLGLAAEEAAGLSAMGGTGAGPFVAPGIVKGAGSGGSQFAQNLGVNVLGGTLRNLLAGDEQPSPVIPPPPPIPASGMQAVAQAGGGSPQSLIVGTKPQMQAQQGGLDQMMLLRRLGLIA